MKRDGGLLIRLAIGLLLGGVAVSSCGDAVDPGVAAIPVVDLDGRVTTIAETAGDRISVVSLWAVWCQPCRRELPVLDLIAVEHPGIAVVAVNIGDEETAVRAFVDDVRVRATVLIDRDGDLLSALDAPSVPVTFVVDDHGTVLWKHVGAVDAEVVRSAVADVERTAQSPVEG